ncbi:MAG: N-acetyltransferase family protein [Coriobacteriia bacterium]|nr:N-acetyltransferase family protein [Coriobacteriia bacterium]
MKALVRDATPADAAAIADIYNPYVTGSSATFDTRPVDAEERLEWLAGHDVRHPVLVAESDGMMIGWGSLTRWASRPAWHRTVEVSIYVDPSRRREGVGTALMEALLDRACEAGHHTVIGQIVADNESSIAVAERTGFERVGVLREVGDKFGRYLDLVLVQRILP